MEGSRASRILSEARGENKIRETRTLPRRSLLLRVLDMQRLQRQESRAVSPTDAERNQSQTRVMLPCRWFVNRNKANGKGLGSNVAAGQGSHTPEAAVEPTVASHGIQLCARRRLLKVGRPPLPVNSSHSPCTPYRAVLNCGLRYKQESFKSSAAARSVFTGSKGWSEVITRLGKYLL